MGAVTTTYDIKLNYQMGGNASSGLSTLASKAEGAMRGLDGLKMALLGVAGVAGIGGAFHKGKEVFIDFNNEMQQLRISMGAVLQMNLGGTFEDAKGKAGALFEEFQRFSTVTPLTTKQIMEFGQSISAAVFTNNGSLQDFVNLTERGAVAAKVFGVSAEFAGIEMQHLLAGDITSRMRFINQLMMPTLARHGMSRGDFKQLDSTKRMSLIKEALNDPGLVNATKDFAKSFEGVTSTFRDKIQISLGKIGLPLFEKITDEVAGWNTWMEKNQVTLQKWGRQVSETLVHGFDLAKRAVMSIIAHKDELMMIGRVWMLGKLGGAVAGGFGNMFGALGQSSAVAANALSGLAGKIQGAGGVIGALGALYVALKLGADLLDEEHRRRIGNAGDVAGIRAAGARVGTDIRSQQRDFALFNRPISVPNPKDAFGLLSKDMAERTAIELVHGAKNLGATSGTTFLKDQFIAALEAKGTDREEAKLIGEATAEAFARVTGLRHLLGLEEKAIDMQQKGVVKKDKDINVRIDKIEVASDDPDKFALGLAKSFERMVKNPVSAESALRGGF